MITITNSCSETFGENRNGSIAVWMGALSAPATPPNREVITKI